MLSPKLFPDADGERSTWSPLNLWVNARAALVARGWGQHRQPRSSTVLACRPLACIHLNRIHFFGAIVLLEPPNRIHRWCRRQRGVHAASSLCLRTGHSVCHINFSIVQHDIASWQDSPQSNLSWRGQVDCANGRCRATAGGNPPDDLRKFDLRPSAGLPSASIIHTYTNAPSCNIGDSPVASTHLPITLGFASCQPPPSLTGVIHAAAETIKPTGAGAIESTSIVHSPQASNIAITRLRGIGWPWHTRGQLTISLAARALRSCLLYQRGDCVKRIYCVKPSTERPCGLMRFGECGCVRKETTTCRVEQSALTIGEFVFGWERGSAQGTGQAPHRI